eukprot:m.168383 g.168383  ORF g.168383 m.168383 type:complete len:131 (-) comp21159_c0_seq6:38-430(-)
MGIQELCGESFNCSCSLGSTGCGRGPIFPNGTIDMAAVAALSRTYPQATAGRLHSVLFDPTTALFEMYFLPSAQCQLPTDIYLNEAVFYPHGYTVSLSSSAASYTTSKNHVYVRVGAAETGLVRVLIQPK